jgi:signal transduction histidine kinase
MTDNEDILESKAQTTILIVDDTAENISILYELLDNYDYSVLVAESGENALAIVAQETPDLILLDVMMPGIDGFETCRQLKRHQHSADIPVIFMTALVDTPNKLKGFELGAVDYITKPFDHEEVLARVSTHLTIDRLQKALHKQNQELKQLNQEKNEFLSIAAHDLKNPLSGIMGLTDLLNMDKSKLSVEHQQYLQMIRTSAENMFALIQKLLDANRIESGRLEVHLSPQHIVPLLDRIVMMMKKQVAAKQLNMHWQPPGEQMMVVVDGNLIYQVFENLVSNAIKYSPTGKNIYLNLEKNADKARFSVRDEGQGMTEEDMRQLFGKFKRLSAQPTAKEHSTGLGLFIVKKLVMEMNGQVWCESTYGEGATFFVEFPLVEG